jgi:hypothetical protein
MTKSEHMPEATQAPLASVLLAQAVSLEAQAATLRALADSLPAASDERPLTIAQAAARFSVSKAGLKGAIRSGALVATLGTRRQPMVAASDVARWAQGRRIIPRPPADCGDRLDYMARTGALVRRAS